MGAPTASGGGTCPRPARAGCMTTGKRRARPERRSTAAGRTLTGGHILGPGPSQRRPEHRSQRRVPGRTSRSHRAVCARSQQEDWFRRPEWAVRPDGATSSGRPRNCSSPRAAVTTVGAAARYAIATLALVGSWSVNLRPHRGHPGRGGRPRCRDVVRRVHHPHPGVVGRARVISRSVPSRYGNAVCSDAAGVRRRGRLRIAHSATVRLTAHAETSSSAVVTSPWPRITAPTPRVNTWVPATRPMA